MWMKQFFFQKIVKLKLRRPPVKIFKQYGSFQKNIYIVAAMDQNNLIHYEKHQGYINQDIYKSFL